MSKLEVTAIQWFILSAMVMTIVLGCHSSKVNDPEAASARMIDCEIMFLHAPDPGAAPQIVSVGTLTIPASFRVEEAFGGTWRLNAAGNTNVEDPLSHDYIAPLHGLGVLTFRGGGTECVFDLNPRVIDNNVELIVSRSVLGEGRWQYVTDAGVSASGVVRISAPTD